MIDVLITKRRGPFCNQHINHIMEPDLTEEAAPILKRSIEHGGGGSFTQGSFNVSTESSLTDFVCEAPGIQYSRS